MSFDELPPDPEAPRPTGGEATGPESEAPPTGAPPAKPTRRRARTAGTAAASATDSPESTPPVRTPRTRRKTAAVQETPAEPEPAPAETASQDKPTPPRRKRSVRAQVAESVVTAAPADVAPDTAPSAPAVETPSPSEEQSSPKRRRAPRSRTAAAAAKTPATPEASTAEAEAAPSDSPTAAPASEEAGDLAEATSPQPAQPTRRRPTRTRRRAGSAEAAAPAAEAPAPDAASAEPEAEASETAAQEPTAAETTPSRSRRRRGGRSRREEPRARVQDATEEPAAPIVLEAAEPEIDRSVGAHLITADGHTDIQINGVAFPPVLFFGNLAGDRAVVLAEVRRAARAGIHLHSTLVELPCPLTEAQFALDTIDERLRTILDADPEGYVMPRIVFVPARGWRREYPTEIASYADGTTGDPSITSERFWQEAERSLTALIAHLPQYEWSKRVFGFHLEQGEWFQPASQGYDRSTANRDAFRDWLREKYKNSLIALRAAWYDGDIQFHTAEIPSITKPVNQRAFFEARRERRTIDFNEFTADSTARRIAALARAAKKACNHQALVSVCYGYTFEFGHPCSGHLALGRLETSRDIDLICGPPSYRDRKPGGAASFPAPIDSPRLHGKLWLSEDDTKTHLAPLQQDPDDFNPRMGDRSATEQAHARAAGRALATGTAVSWMDLWGEGWLNEDPIWERLNTYTECYRASQRERAPAQPAEVVVLIDESSLLHVQRGETFFRRLTNGLRDTLQRAGVSYRTYLQSDLLAPGFPTDAKLYLFLTPYRLTPDQRAAIKEKLQTGGKTVAWLYAPGTAEERPSVGSGMEEAATGTTGFTLRQQEWNAEVGSRITEPYHILTEKMTSRELGARERLNPSFCVDDPDATILAEYQASNLPSLAVRDFGTWKSVFIGDPVLPLDLLRGICRYAGVHVWTPQGDDVLYVGNGWVTIHATRDGQRTLSLPQRTGIYDATDCRLIADEALEYRFTLKAGMTRIFCIGSTERFLKLRLPNVTPYGIAREKIVIAAQAQSTPQRRDTSSIPAPLRADLETLEAVLTVDVSALDALDMPPSDVETLTREPLPERPAVAPRPDDSQPSADGAPPERRRRRRGGRGRGRRRPESSSQNTGQAGGAATASEPAQDGGPESSGPSSEAE